VVWRSRSSRFSALSPSRGATHDSAQRVSLDFPWAPTREQYELETPSWLAELQNSADLEQAFARRLGRPPSDPVVRERARATRLTVSPGALLALRRMNMDVDVRGALATIQAPTLIVHRTADLADKTDTSATEIARYMAENIAGSRVLEIGRFDWLPFEVIGEFVVEAWEERAVERRRVLATVLVTDLVDSTAKALESGSAWPSLLAEHNAVIRRELARFRGETIDPLRVRDPGGRRLARPWHSRRRAHRRVRRGRRQARRAWPWPSARASPPRRKSVRCSSPAR
jgi:hypothetical protein